jgi:hypothetical protein
MLEITKLLKSFWGEDLSTTCYVQNKSFTSTMLRPLMNVGQVENHILPIFVYLVVLNMNMYLEKNVKNLMYNLLFF